ncbi:MAG: L,D-transpeptidase [Anaerolineae bacterium]|nr:MAG: L,D-transpeptidase [Anaerolineae bacterium]
MADVSPHDRHAQAAALRNAGIAAAQAGQKAQARRYLRQSIALDDDVEETWLWLAGVATTPQESVACLQRALIINPHSRHARAGLRWAQQQVKQEQSHDLASTQMASPGHPLVTPASVPPRPYRWDHWVGAALVVWLIVLLTGGFLVVSLGIGSPVVVLPRPTPTNTPVPNTPTPTTLQRIETLHPPLNAAWEAKDWPECVRILEQIQALDSHYGGIKAWLIAVYLAWGQELVAEGQLEEAVAHFGAVLALDPDEKTAREQRVLALAYLAARASYAARDWQKATYQLQAVLGLDDDYQNAEELLYQCYYQLGLARQANGELVDAKHAFEQALVIHKGGTEAQAALEQVVFLLTPPTPTPVPKRIEIYIGQQRMLVYEGDHLIWNWVVSTGEPGRPTRTGHFQVLDKIPNAYASRWNLQMPYWLGIYYVGPSENGIHALPILSNGQRLWEGFLGRPVSYGCVILGVEEARLLYEWAAVGTPVDIYP